MSSSTAIELNSNPIEKDYEDYICAYFQAGGIYVEKSIIYRGKAELLELDIITSNFCEDSIDKYLIEIKSGGWGFNDIFKVKGWMTYLKIEQGAFVAKKTKNSIEYFQSKCDELDIKLIDNSDLSKTDNALSQFLIQKPEEKEIETIRFSYLLERKLLKSIKELKRKFPEIEAYKKLDDYFFKINSGTFFSRSPVRRIGQLFDIHIKYKNITAKLCTEIETGIYDEDITQLSNSCFKTIFYKGENSPLQISLYIEHLARVTILKCCTEQLLRKHKEQFKEDAFIESLDYLSIPQTIKKGLSEIVNDTYFHRYPIFWQFFTYVMGGFILLDKEKEELEYISENTGIPVDEIPNAFEAFNKLFPKTSGWFFNIPKTQIRWHRFFPVCFSGIGANHRRFIHLESEPKENQTYENLGKLLTGDKTLNDLIKWNNLGYEIFK